MHTSTETLWMADSDVRNTSVMGRFLASVEEERGLSFLSYQEAQRWSTDRLADFWESFVRFAGVRFHALPRAVLEEDGIWGASWFSGTTLNYAEHCLMGPGSEDTLVAYSETREKQIITRAEMRDGVARIRAGLESLGVGRGDCVAGYLPNCPEGIMALLAVASLGAIWTSCAPDFGPRAVIDRLEQVGPKVLLTVNGYVHKGRVFDRRDEVAEIRRGLPDLLATVELEYIETASISSEVRSYEAEPGTYGWSQIFGRDAVLEFDPVPFDHPLYIVYSSGTTGRPKAIMHSHGGIVLENLKWLHLHEDVQHTDTVFWFASTTWMAWNISISSLMCGAKLVTFDGDPMYPDLDAYWRRLSEEKVTYVGISPAFLMACRKAGMRPREVADLTSIRTMTVGGAPLPAQGFEWVYEAVGEDLYLSSSSGGTDIASSIVGGCRLLPVSAGKIACRLMGVASEALDAHGRILEAGQEGELVLTRPMPSMPIGFWGDDGTRYHESYFAKYDGVWCHGDWITFSEDGSSVISGRSDATLNRGGVRIGTGEIYLALGGIEEVEDSLVVHLEDAEGGFGQLILFVKPSSGAQLDEELESRIRRVLRKNASPRHVPDVIVEAPTIPINLSNKKLEIPVKRLLCGASIDSVVNKAVLLQPHSLDWYAEFARARRPHESKGALHA